MNRVLKFILFPFAVLYDSITSIRNILFDYGIFRSISFQSVLITVGNLTVGGTGKTPHIEYLIRLVQNQFKTATLSRGYGRKTQGVLIADPTATADKIADEPMQFYLKYGKNITVAVGEKRTLAVPKIMLHQPDNEIILLDDAFQHRNIRADLQILLSDYQRPFYQDFLLPAGRLRENRKGAKRADIIIVSKCPPDLKIEQKQEIRQQIQRYSHPKTPIFFTAIRYLKPISLECKFSQISKSILLVTGIAQTDTLLQKLRADYQIVKHLKYPDHAHYDTNRIREIQMVYHKKRVEFPDLTILTTEKDFVKLNNPDFAVFGQKFPVFYLPIEIYFLEKSDDFDQLILRKIHQIQREKP